MAPSQQAALREPHISHMRCAAAHLPLGCLTAWGRVCVGEVRGCMCREGVCEGYVCEGAPLSTGTRSPCGPLSPHAPPTHTRHPRMHAGDGRHPLEVPVQDAPQSAHLKAGQEKVIGSRPATTITNIDIVVYLYYSRVQGSKPCVFWAEPPPRGRSP